MLYLVKAKYMPRNIGPYLYILGRDATTQVIRFPLWLIVETVRYSSHHGEMTSHLPFPSGQTPNTTLSLRRHMYMSDQKMMWLKTDNLIWSTISGEVINEGKEQNDTT
jgi:hypothetical protein